jgi:hypothetical protein
MNGDGLPGSRRFDDRPPRPPQTHRGARAGLTVQAP